MLNLLWAVMMAAGLIWGAFHGTLGEVTNGALEAAREAVTLGITMLGVMSFWTGILEIGRKSGLMEALAGKMYPILHMLFPRIPRDHPALESICANVTANLLGLGWAATPAGLKAMGDLKALEEERRRQRDVRAVNVRVSHYQYFFSSADSHDHDRLPGPVRIRKSGGSDRSGASGHQREHSGGRCILRCENEGYRNQGKSGIMKLYAERYGKTYEERRSCYGI